MRIVDVLVEEHRLIDAAAGSLVRWARGLPAGGDGADDRARFVGFLRGFVIEAHERLEEDVLFPALVEHCEVRADRGPIAVLRAEHARLAEAVDALERAGDRAAAQSAALEIARSLWEHVDKENSVLLQEAQERLVRNGVRNLDGSPPSAAAESARRIGEGLVERYPPLEDTEVVRGDGCVCCAAFGEGCRGIEAEWWSSWEWEHHRSLDEG